MTDSREPVMHGWWCDGGCSCRPVRIRWPRPTAAEIRTAALRAELDVLSRDVAEYEGTR